MKPINRAHELLATHLTELGLRRRIVKVVHSVAYELEGEPLLFQPDEIRALRRKERAK